LFETQFNVLDGIGANVGKGLRFTRMPRADLSAPGQWATHVPARATGPNAQSCTGCHRVPVDDGSGGTETTVIRDPLHSGVANQCIQRDTPHLFAMGGIQRLAEEMTETLQQIRDSAGAAAVSTRTTVTRSLVAKGISFGSIKASPKGTPPKPVYDTSAVVGVDADLVVKPFQWKGSVAFIRDFNRDALHNELGMQAIEIVGQ